MIDALYNYRQGDIHAAEFSDEFNKLCIPFEESLSEEQIDVFHKLLDCVSDTAAAEMRAAYKVGFKGQYAPPRQKRQVARRNYSHRLPQRRDIWRHNLFLPRIQMT